MINHGKGRYDGILEKAARGERSLFRDAQERREEKIEKHGPSARAHGPPGEKVTAFFDFFSDGLQRELNVIMKQGDLGMRADSRGGNTVQNIHQRRPSPHIETAPPVNPDGSHVFPGLEKSGIFKTKNAVYSITCKVPGCEHEEYTGQTGGQCGSRFKDHISDTVHGRMHSSICGHYKSKHPHLCKKLSLGANLKARGRNKALRLILEALYIQLDKPSLNMKFEGGRSHNVELFIDQTEEQRRAAAALQKRLREERREQTRRNQEAGRGRPRAQHAPFVHRFAVPLRR
jgi:hypothetical protein